MKFIVCQHNKDTENPFEIYTLPDTAFHFNKRPFFIPDYATPCIMHQHQAVRICRLGRNISARFAYRYFDAVTLCSRMEAPSLPTSVGRCFDECLTVGEWIEHKGLPGDNMLLEEASFAIAEVSRYFTLRQGDVILLHEVEEPNEVQIDQHIEVCYQGHNVLRFNIK